MKTFRASMVALAAICGLSSPSSAQSEEAPPAAAEQSLDLAALGMGDSSNSSVGGSESSDSPLNIYGFGDVGTISPLYGKKNIWSSSYTPSTTSAAVGNMNVYLSKQLDKKWSVLTEVRFHYAPNQVADDPSDSNRAFNMGGIEIERAHIDYTHHQWLNIRAGQWLTPYGIWNVDHGTPTLIAIRRPYGVGEQLFPERQTGLLAFGGDYVGPVRIGYNVGVSNGRGPKSQYADLDRNQAITARLDLGWSSEFGSFKIGSSFYTGKYTDANAPKRILKPDLSDGSSEEDIKVVYDERAFGADLQYDLGSFVLRAEYLLNDRVYQDPYRPKNESGVFTSDSRRTGYYGLVGYRIPSLSLMPYFLFENFNFGDGQYFVKEAKIFYSGLNYQIVPRVVAKVEYVVVKFRGIAAIEKSDLAIFATQLAWAF